MRFRIVIFIALMEICCWFLGALDRLGRNIFMEPLLFMALDHLMEAFGLGEFHFSLDDRACWFGGLLTCSCLVDHPLVTYFLVSGSMLSHYGVVFVVLAYLGYG
jgi:hypothetical protein